MRSIPEALSSRGRPMTWVIFAGPEKSNQWPGKFRTSAPMRARSRGWRSIETRLAVIAKSRTCTDLTFEPAGSLGSAAKEWRRQPPGSCAGAGCRRSQKAGYPKAAHQDSET